MKIPSGLKERYERLLGNEVGSFLEALLSPLKPSIRINTLKGTPQDIRNRLESKGLKLTRIPWCPWGYWIENLKEESSLGNSLEHFLGEIYIQEASSMIPVEAADITPQMKVLDIAAAPGSKTTHAAQKMGNRGVIVANDVSIHRIKALTYNLDRMGVINTVVTSMDGRRFGRLLPNYFHVSLVDAPCSAEGTVRKSFRAWSNWRPTAYKKLAETQKALLISAFKATLPGGTIIYSTCTFAPEENEGVVSYLLDHYPCHLEAIQLPGLDPLPGLPFWEEERYNPQVEKAIRVYPHRNEVGGFFVAKIRKEEATWTGSKTNPSYP